MNLILEKQKAEKNALKVLTKCTMYVYITYIPLILGGFPCSQAHNLLTCDHLDLKDKISPIKKIRKSTTFVPKFSKIAAG